MQGIKAKEEFRGNIIRVTPSGHSFTFTCLPHGKPLRQHYTLQPQCAWLSARQRGNAENPYSLPFRFFTLFCF